MREELVSKKLESVADKSKSAGKSTGKAVKKIFGYSKNIIIGLIGAIFLMVINFFDGFIHSEGK